MSGGDYIKSIEVTYNDEGHIQKIYATTKNEIEYIVGCIPHKNNKQLVAMKIVSYDLANEERPVCLFGSIANE